MKYMDEILHARGRSLFVDDLPVPENTLHAAVFGSPVAHGRIVELDLSPALAIVGVSDAFAAADIAGENQIGSAIMDEPLLAGEHVHYAGQPMAVIVAKSARTARQALCAVKVAIEKAPVVLDPREAYEQGSLIFPPRIFSMGDVDKAWDKCDVIVEGRADSGGQEHLYLETQAALAIPLDGGGVRVLSSTQSPTSVQRIVARVAGLAMNQVEVEAPRLGGAFGGKEDQATPWAAMAAVAALRLDRPVKLVLNRGEDMRMTGKRHPYSTDFKIGLLKDGRILAYQAMFYQNAGAAADLSPAILERTLLHATNSYFIPNVRATAASCRTNIAPSTAFRGFGGPQAMFVMESAIYKAGETMGMDPAVIQRRNLLKNNDTLPYGMRIDDDTAVRCFDTLEETYELDRMRRDVEKFNDAHVFEKRGLAIMPICFGISFTSDFLNQARALVHVYTDGSVGVSAGAVEMGQGVNTKIRQVAARVFSIDPDLVKVLPPDTTRVAGMSPTAASTGADLNGQAVKLACEDILGRLKRHAAEKLMDGVSTDGIRIESETVFANGETTPLTWKKLVSHAYFSRVNLSAQAHYATPGLYFDRKREKGTPFAYHVFGAAVLRATVDCLRGTYRIDLVKAVHDFGESLNPAIDLGQTEGAIVQGIGWMTMEQIMIDEQGRLITDTLSAYKAPDIRFAPDEIAVHFLENAENPRGLFNSKAVGEPPLMYGIGAYFAVINAIKAFKNDIDVFFDAPLTPEKALLFLCKDQP